MPNKNKIIELLNISHHHVVWENGTEGDAESLLSRLAFYSLQHQEINKFIKEYGKNGLAQICRELDALKQYLLKEFLPENEKLDEKKPQLNRAQALEM